MDRSQYIAPEYPQDSYSRQLDNMVASQEMPYGYDANPPASDQQNPTSVEQMNNKAK